MKILINIEKTGRERERDEADVYTKSEGGNCSRPGLAPKKKGKREGGGGGGYISFEECLREIISSH